MSEEAAFIEALTKDTLDDVTRGVYADWLEERGDPRAAFLRAEISLSELPDGDPRWFELAAAVPREGVDEAWAVVVGPRWDLWLLAYDPHRKINAIKVIRELTGLGLAESKAVSEALPSRIQGGYGSVRALRAATYLREACGHSCPSGAPVELRRSTLTPFVGWVGAWQPPPSATPAVCASATPISVWMLGYPPQNKVQLIRLVREMGGMALAEAKRFVEQPMPVCLASGQSASDAESLRVRFLAWAAVEVRNA